MAWRFELALPHKTGRLMWINMPVSKFDNFAKERAFFRRVQG
jgi:hypothetical protein